MFSFYFLELILMIVFLLFWILVGYSLYFFFSPKRQPITEAELNELNLSKSAMAVVGLLVLAYNVFLYEVSHTNDAVMGLGFGLFSLVAFPAWLVLFPRRKRTPLAYFLATTGVVSGLSFAFRANEVVLGFNLIISWVSVMGLLWIHVLSQVQWEGLWILPRLRDFLFGGLRHLMVFFKGLFQFKNRSRSQALQVFKIVIFTFIVLIFFTGLLMQADPIFETLVEDIQEEAMERLFVSLVLGGLALLALTFKLKTEDTEASSFSWLGFYELVIPIVALELLFAAFLGIQARYLFGSHADLSTFDLTYSEYIRKGFMELLATTFFASILSYALILKGKTLSSNGEKRALQILNAVLVVLLAALLASALKRDLLYVEVYGLTRIRFIGLILLGWLGALLALLFSVNFLRKMQEKHLWSGVLGVTAVAFVAMNACNIDRTIANTPPPEGRTMDYFYIANLSPDAVEAWPNMVMVMAEEFESLRTTTKPDEATLNRLAEIALAVELLLNQRNALEELLEALTEAGSEENTEDWDDYGYSYYDSEAKAAERHWTSWNWSQQHALQWIQNEQAVFHGTLECLQREMIDYQLFNLNDLYDEERSRLYDYEYPLMNGFYGFYPKSFGELVQQSPLYDEAFALFGTSYPEPDDFLNSDPEFLERFKAAHTVEACRLTSSDS